eukprot:CAMPEP_0204088996 /NCGR_PEP_ID=MMETSP0360-20130528/187080_1 /ASSEMBLY_ACC=CAM_ASM_000342 /TAXON_ID=268821 /ORGANISM="Scrippsiella Hangoei, Strain SHTV-5" /LENGTH=67 /DNA_ID=CAMNT_0051038197 /DNA_START=161 /DNA_END=365 /DNA_ORIENTATION=+
MEQSAGYLDTEIANAQCGSHPSDDALGSDLSPDAQTFAAQASIRAAATQGSESNATCQPSAVSARPV